MQEVLGIVREEVLATTKLPMAIDFLLSELRHAGILGSAMARLEHYFTPFQVFVVQEAEDERRRFDLRVGLEMLRREAEYRAEEPSRQGLFLYQFEAICRNRLGYDRGLEAVARDPAFDETWSNWIRTVRRQIGMVDLADLIYVHSEFYYGGASRAVALAPDEDRDLGGEDAPARGARKRSRALSCSANARGESRSPTAARTRCICLRHCTDSWAIRRCRGRCRSMPSRLYCPNWPDEWSSSKRESSWSKTNNGAGST